MSEELIHQVFDRFPLVAIFVVFVIWLAKFHRAERKDETEAWRRERKDETGAWRKFIEDQNGRSEKAIGEVAFALQKNTDSLSQNTAQLGENEKILERIRERVGD